MSLSRKMSKPVKCSRHFNQNGLVGDRIYSNNTTTAECNSSECQVLGMLNYHKVHQIKTYL